MGQTPAVFINQEMQKQALAHAGETSFVYLRDRDQVEADTVTVFDTCRMGGIKVKASAAVTDSGFSGLRNFRWKHLHDRSRSPRRGSRASLRRQLNRLTDQRHRVSATTSQGFSNHWLLNPMPSRTRFLTGALKS